ncbi:antA/AntB antirepressor family protein [Enterococcus cecorum]|uniref:antA/AntB antirepressor family protein n=1 Tax=Enterococcus cecorum TaxID=44008 RepID=UPI00148BF3BD|nr:antA/AntB antirepressor family protein [Enterococcus cecorum]MCJ0567002.1 antA/AntB antirepressor family protein [Enterococcus cecorum]MDZ5439289.1 antA/AntB antirepressor family protein [Enterococcus cecorum]MDZ5497422.1 antA/AntB antirepressor family protein [Enterococcus cecorum]MDZ5509547.1 antA/AntB antirepressor family protein [Enterococcus cecorum]MDZ5585190.1 antA/AntB antirepressor family protein [Enterococcus cecorum]
MELIKIKTNENGEQLVSGRELHEFLEVNEKYTDWFKRMVEYGFAENVDFIGLSEKSEKLGGRPRMNHAMTLNMAKEVSMIQRTEKGKQARLYFIDVENQYKAIQKRLPNTREAIQQLLLQGVEEVNQRVDIMEERLSNVEENAKLDTGDYNVISKRVKKRVYEVARAYGLNVKQSKLLSPLFKDINGGIKRIANVDARTQLCKKHYQSVMDFINDWEPATATRYEIKQMKLDI